MSRSGVVEQLQYDRPPLPPAPVTFEEFLAWADEDTHAEWVDGEVVLMSPVSLEHQDVLTFLYRLIIAYVEAKPTGLVGSSWHRS
jgi:Uma2 family endonuclease